MIVAMMLVAVHARADTEQRARAVLDDQLAAVNDPSALAARLAPDTLVFGNGSFALAGGPNGGAVLATLAASDVLPAIMWQVDGIAAGGDDDATWLVADVTFVHRARLGRSLPRVTRARIVELIAAGRVTAFGFATSTNRSAPGDALANPGSGRLLSFALEGWRDHDVRVVGFLEVRAAAWGFVAADLIVDDRSVRSLVLAIPAMRGEWTVVAKLER